MKKNYFRMLAMMLLSMMGLNASAHDIAVANADGVTIYYNYSSDYRELVVTYRGDNFTSYNEYSGNVVIPDEVTYMNRTRKVTSIGNSAFEDCSGLTSVTIPNSVTSIGNYTFRGCSGLTSVTIGNSVTSIGDCAFTDCSGLTSITIPNSVTSIGDYAFANCSGLTSVTIPNSVTSIGNSAFSGCDGLTSVTIPNSVTSIGNSTFANCSGLTSVTIPNSVTSIESGAFSGCSGLTSVTIPNSVTSIGVSAFNGCYGLTSVVSLIENPFEIAGKGSRYPTFSNNTFINVTLYVPVGTIDKYKSTAGWQDFVWMEEGTGEGGTTPGAKKCATPTISFADGKLTFSCETEGVSYTYEITNDDVKRGNASEVQLAVVYKVSVYATKYGYEDSDVATAEFTFGGNADTGVRGDMNGDNIVNALDIQTIIMIAAMF